MIVLSWWLHLAVGLNAGAGSSIFLRETGKDNWLLPLRGFIDQPTKKKALEEFRQLLYYRGSVPTKEGQGAISQEILEREIARGFKTRGISWKRLGYFANGMAIGSEEFIRTQINRMRDERRYSRRKNPGSREAPLKNLDKAIKVAAAGDTILVAEGVYSGTFDIGYFESDKPLKLYGGFSSD